MRRARLAYPGSYHHVTNRGLRGEKIFFDSRAKEYFLEALRRQALNHKMRLLSYCLLGNHYHLILQNPAATLSAFMRDLNGQYGVYYRKRRGGKGYVFQGRYYSTLIQEDRYLRMAILYVLLNPVRAAAADSPWEYRWSSIGEYFAGRSSRLVDNGFVEELFSNKNEFRSQMTSWRDRKLQPRHTRLGAVLGDEHFVRRSAQLFERRTHQGIARGKRIDDYCFKSPDEVISKFEQRLKTPIRDIDLGTHRGKALRARLLVQLKDEAGLTYEEIKAYPVFRLLKQASMGQLYKRAKSKERESPTR